MEEDETNAGVILKNITSNRIKATFSPDGEGIYKYNEIPPFVEFDDEGKSSYKHLGTIKSTRGENVFYFSVRKRNNRKHKHFTFTWSGIIKKVDIRDIKDEDKIRNPDTVKKYQMVTSRLRLPKSAVKNLRDEFNEFLYPTPKKVKQIEGLFEILRLPYALDLIKIFSEKEDMTIQEFRDITKIKKSKSYKCLESFVKLGFLRSHKQGRSGIKIYRITLDKKRINKIMAGFID